jgi:hypothetical protein
MKRSRTKHTIAPLLSLNSAQADHPKSGSYPVVGKPDVGFGGPMMGAMRSLM